MLMKDFENIIITEAYIFGPDIILATVGTLGFPKKAKWYTVPETFLLEILRS